MKNSFKIVSLAMAIAVSVSACDPAKVNSNQSTIDTPKKSVDTSKKIIDTTKKDTAKKQ
ncbi:MAG: hypothetical protein JWP37_565 [Mucilaginibacter sp.]|nr:hypothetical protein [Mucilaginibacter sp.]